jgi:hypothetical protein
MKILYVGPLWEGSTCLHRMIALKDLGHELFPVDTEPQQVQHKQKLFFYRVRRKLFGPWDIADANKQICQIIKKDSFDVIWLDKALTIFPKTIQLVKTLNHKTIIAGYSPDDMAGKHNQSRAFLDSLSLYHVFFTTKSYGVKELEDLGAHRVVFIGNAYDPHTHHPMQISPQEKQELGGPVGFIGDYEKERALSMYYLAQHGIPVRIWGPNWARKCALKQPNLKIEGKPLWGDDYTKAICSFDINLVFLRKANRDLQTSRSIEIPACGDFMLAERTNENLELFEEGKEAEFFSSDEELLEKVRFYLAHPEERNRIAAAGRERCMKSGYSNQERLKAIFKILTSNNF